MKQRNPVMLWLLCALSYFATSADGVKSTCNAGSVRMGEEARITCRFEEDISKTQHDVRLFYNTTPVLVIAWSDGSPEIHTKHGYQFDGKINDTITLEIPDAKLDQAGLYACHIVLSDANDASPCTLKVTGDWYITTAKDPCPKICSTSSAFNNTCISNDNRASVYKIVIAILTGILSVFVSISIAFAFYIRQNLKRTKLKETDNVCNSPMSRMSPQSQHFVSEDSLHVYPLMSRKISNSPSFVSEDTLHVYPLMSRKISNSPSSVSEESLHVYDPLMSRKITNSPGTKLKETDNVCNSPMSRMSPQSQHSVSEESLHVYDPLMSRKISNSPSSVSEEPLHVYHPLTSRKLSNSPGFVSEDSLHVYPLMSRKISNSPRTPSKYL